MAKFSLALIALFTGIIGVIAKPTQEMEKLLRKEGFQFVGNFTQEDKAGGVLALGASTQALTLWLSSASAVQDEAVRGCWGVGGELVSMLNFLQEGDVRQALNFQGIIAPVWTSGIWDGARSQWYWRTGDRAAVYTNFLASCEVRSAGFGIVYVPGGAGNWCSERTTTSRRYLCSL